MAQVQTTSGLVITPNAVDGAEVTSFKITSVANGALFQADGTTPIADGASITVAQGAAGLRFTPIDTIDFDVIYGRNLLGEGANWITVGFTVRIGDN